MNIIKIAALMSSFLLLSSRLLGQNLPEFGNVTTADFAADAYRPDSSANAVIIFDRGTIDQFSDGTSIFKTHVRLKIFSRTAFDTWGNVKLLVGVSSVSKIKGATYTLEGGQIVRTELDDKSIFRAKEGKYRERISFAFPSVKEGSIIEYSYNLRLDSWRLPSWSFQTSVPTLTSTFTVFSQVWWRYQEDIRGTVSPERDNNVKSRIERRWVLKNVPAFKSEPLMPHAGIYRSSIRFWNSSSNWGTLGKQLLSNENFGGILVHPRVLKKTALEIIEGMTDPREKIKSISKFVKSTLSWDGTCDVYADLPKDVLEKKTATAADINLLFASLLRQAGLKVDPVLVSTRDHGLVLQNFPSLTQFDYVICRVMIDSTMLLLDGTEKNLPYDVLPSRCLNYDGFVVTEGGGEWIAIGPQAKFKESGNADLSLTEDGTILGTVKVNREGYDAFLAREYYSKRNKEEFLKTFTVHKSWQVEKSDVQNYETTDLPLKEEYIVQTSDEVTQSGDIMYVNPIILLKESTNPFVKEKREYPIDFTAPIERTYIATLKLPDDYELDEIPKSLIIKLPQNEAKATLNYSRAGNKLFVSYNLQVNKALFFKEEYPALRELYTRLVSKMDEQIVVRKRKR